MDRDAKIYVAGHRGLVGSAIMRGLQADGYNNLLTRTHAEVDLRRQAEVEAFFETERPEYVFLAAAKVGGILANNTYKAEFIYDNLMIAANVINAAHKLGVKKLLNLGSSCIYPKLAPQPLREEYLLTSSLEPTNEPYAIAKISAAKLCCYFNEQYGTNFISVMPTNLYGPGDNFDLETSHVLPALIRKCHLAKLAAKKDWEAIKRDEEMFGTLPDDIRKALCLEAETTNRHCGAPRVVLWGSGRPRREFLHVDDLADAVIYLMNRYDKEQIGSFLNIGVGEDASIQDLSKIVRSIVGYEGEVIWDTTKPDGTPRKLLDVTRLSSLGWKSTISLKEGINETYEWYLETLNGGFSSAIHPAGTQSEAIQCREGAVYVKKPECPARKIGDQWGWGLEAGPSPSVGR